MISKTFNAFRSAWASSPNGDKQILVARTIIGGLLMAAGLAAVAAAWAGEDLEQRNLILGVGAGAVLLGLLVISPILARPVVGLIGLPFRLLRPSGKGLYLIFASRELLPWLHEQLKLWQEQCYWGLSQGLCPEKNKDTRYKYQKCKTF